MIGQPFINVRCDALLPGGEQCRRAEVFSLPSFVDSDQAARLFLAVNPAWRRMAGLRLTCPECSRIMEGVALELRARAEVGA